ncbi:Usg family protein [Microvirga tunisiensis]|uniref:Usg family protein n=2 Tax=Pannonibacter tanglangensis TaxID=2750084 RepID=A0ABW9ZJ24_9HYPH|nr:MULTISPECIES: Usg family protein [unclassified Pannonibacter]NBN63606.1 Usg family protein [Pannonibacter sp. XCT-34]NBN77242.1 Usg family protein [Pannonibacter sp. XCT-53]
MQASESFRRQFAGYGILTAEILYRMPDHPALLQSFVWQTEDKAPQFPELRRFLAYWEREIEALIHSVRVAHKDLIGPMDVRYAKGEFLIH